MMPIRRTLVPAAAAVALVAASLVFASGAKALTAGSTTTCFFTTSGGLYPNARPGGMTLCTTQILTFSHTDTLCIEGQEYTQDVFILVVDQRVYAGNQVGPGASLRPHAKLLYTFEHGASLAADDPVATGQTC